MISRAFKNYGLFLNIQCFSPEKLLNDFKLIVLSRAPNRSLIQGIPCGLTTMLNTGDNGMVFKGAAAESTRRLFEGTTPTMTFEFSWDETNTKSKTEIIEKYGLGLLYKSFSNGNRTSIITSSILIPKIIEEIQSNINSNEFGGDCIIVDSAKN